MQADQIKTWAERCEDHPDHDGIVTEAMIRQRMQEEIDDLRALLAGKVLCEKEPVAWKYDLEYGTTVANSLVFKERRNYPFGVCGADYRVRNDDGVSYIREIPLYAAADIGKEGGE
jgi:hypothetical protein